MFFQCDILMTYTVTHTMNNKPPQRKPWYKKPSRIILLCVALLISIPLISTLIWMVNGLLRTPINTIGKVSFEHTLPIPVLAASTVTTDGTRVFNLNLQQGTTKFFDDTATQTWGINGSYLGPTLRAKNGEPIQINVTNQLGQTTSIHWHGMHLPAKMDGGPHQPIQPNTTWSPNWTLKQPAATLWYHPHPHGETEDHVYRGLAGMFIIDDGNPTQATLPHEYGLDDIPVIVQDKSFTADKQFDRQKATVSATGSIGNEIIVNGSRTPHLNISAQHVRLRLLNGSTARIYNFGLSNDQDMQMIASDGGLLEQPVAKKRIMLSPGERAEVIVTLKPGEQASLRCYPLETGAGFLADRLNGSNDTLEIMQLRATQSLTPSAAIPEHLATVEKLPESAAVTTRTIDLTSEQSINGKSMDMERIDFSVIRDSVEIWDVTNKHDTPHSFHIHDVQYQVLSVDGQTPPPELQGRKDTILIKPNHTVRLIMKFADYSDPSYPYMFHCHLLRHEDNGMMGQFTVLEPGQANDPSGMEHMDHSQQ